MQPLALLLFYPRLTRSLLAFANTMGTKRARCTTGVNAPSHQTAGNMNNEAATIATKLKGAHYTPLTSHEESWIIVAKAWLPSTKEKFDEMWEFSRPKERRALKVYGRHCREKRYSLSWGARYQYSGQIADGVRIPPDSFVAQLMEQCRAFAPLNGCLQNWYEPEDTIGLHADDERALVPGSPIVALSWGATRRFLIKPIKGGRRLDLELEDGDLLIMGGTMQQTHKHEIPVRRKTKDKYEPGRRISWTFRNFHFPLEDDNRRSSSYESVGDCQISTGLGTGEGLGRL